MVILKKVAKLTTSALAAIAIALSTRAEPLNPRTVVEANLPITCDESAQSTFDLALALLYANAFPAAARGFNEVLRRDPSCAMGHWGIAMAKMGDPRGTGPSQRDLAEGAAASARAKALGGRTEIECDLIDAADEYFHRHGERAHAARLLEHEKSLRRTQERFPQDHQAKSLHDRVFEALAMH